MDQVMMRAFAQELAYLQKEGGMITQLGKQGRMFAGKSREEAAAMTNYLRNHKPAAHPTDLGRGFQDKAKSVLQSATKSKKTPTQGIDIRAVQKHMADNRPKDAIRAAVTRGTPVTATPTSLDQLSQMSFSSLR